MHNLTPRQRQTIETACRRDSLKEAAAEMGIAYATAKNHSSAAYERLGVPGLPAACLLIGETRGPERPSRMRAIWRRWRRGELADG